ncbi:MAG: hypothetical protein JXR10_04485 [Cyclobacteriaceae bacterium]
MKNLSFKITLITLFFVSAYSASAQYVSPSTSTTPAPSTFYLAFSTGIDNYTGILGIGGLFPFSDKFGLRTGVGIGAWGGKISIGAEYIDLRKSGIGLGLSYSLCTGIEEVDLTLQDQSGSTRTVNMDLERVGSVNLTIKKNWVLKKGNIFYIESGYAFQTGGSDYYTINDNNTTLSPDEELILSIIRPGGLIVAMGFLVAF